MSSELLNIFNIFTGKLSVVAPPLDDIELVEYSADKSIYLILMLLDCEGGVQGRVFCHQ